MTRLNVGNIRHPDGSSDNISLDSSGRVGIGTATPSTLLHLEGDTNPELRVVDTTNSVTGFVKATNGSVDIGSSSNHSIQFYANNTQVFRATATANQDFKFNSGYGSVATAYGVRAWVNFNGRNTLSIYDDGGISSITDNGTGDYTVNFNFTMPDINYAFAGSASYAAAASSAIHTVELRHGTARSTSKTTTSIRHDVVYSDGSQNRTRFDYDEISIVYFR